MRGFFGIGIYAPKKSVNIGTLWRGAYLFGANFMFTIGGQKYSKQASDTYNTTKHIPLWHFESFEDFKKVMPVDAPLIAVELISEAMDIGCFNHPERAIYMLGAEDNGIPIEICKQCHKTIYLPTPIPRSMNVAVAGNIVMYDRQMKGIKNDEKK